GVSDCVAKRDCVSVVAGAVAPVVAGVVAAVVADVVAGVAVTLPATALPWVTDRVVSTYVTPALAAMSAEAAISIGTHPNDLRATRSRRADIGMTRADMRPSIAGHRSCSGT